MTAASNDILYGLYDGGQGTVGNRWNSSGLCMLDDLDQLPADMAHQSQRAYGKARTSLRGLLVCR